MIYLDHAAATPVSKEVLKAMLPYFTEIYGNPSSLHDQGLQAKSALYNSRETIKRILKVDKVIFTASATESINLALNILKPGDHLITTKIEHTAVLATAKHLKDVKVTYLKVDKHGLISTRELTQAIKKNTKLISIHYVNNEIGTIQPMEKIIQIANKHNIILHTDACQAGFMKLPQVDLITINAAKIYGPKGIALLAVRGDIQLKPIIYGGEQEHGIRSGTENIPLIVGFAKALEIAQKQKVQYYTKLTKLRDYFITAVKTDIPRATLNGHKSKRAANNVNINFKVNSEQLLYHLDQKGIYVSTGSACTSNQLTLSHVLLAIGHKKDQGAIRFTLGKTTTKKEIDIVVKELKKITSVLRKI